MVFLYDCKKTAENEKLLKESEAAVRRCFSK